MQTEPMKRSNLNVDQAFAGVREAPWIADLFPHSVAAFEAVAGFPGDPLFGVEQACVAQAVKSRVAEFACGRACARAALARLGLTAVPIPAGPDRAPVWPAGFIGSISHSNGYCVAVAARAQLPNVGVGSRSIGIDMEQLGAVTPELWSHLLRAEERAELDELAEAERRLAATIQFSAKEAFYKAQYPLTKSWLEFGDVSVELQPHAFVVHVVHAGLPVADLGRSFKGRFLVTASHVVAAVAI